MMLEEKLRIMFYGGCTGIGKSEFLRDAIKSLWKDNVHDKCHEIMISEKFIEKISNDKDGDNSDTVRWHIDNWKQYDKEIVDDLLTEISEAQPKLYIINNHFSTISSYGFLPGMDMDSLENLLSKLFLSNDNNKIVDPVLGVLLIDTDQNVISAHYEAKYSKMGKEHTPMLQYISKEAIQRDLEENRQWAESYYARAVAVLGKEAVISDTIYIDANIKKSGAVNTIKNFLRRMQSTGGGS